MAANKLTGQVPDANAPSGSVIQVVSVFKNDTFSSTSASPTWTDVTGLSVSITPTSSSNKILVLCAINIGSNVDSLIRLVRDSTPVGNGSGGNIQGIGQTAPGPGADLIYQPFCFATSFLDSPATTSATTYKIQGANSGGGGTLWINRRSIEASFIVSSQITVMEIAA
jgi:hypothetical protein